MNTTHSFYEHVERRGGPLMLRSRGADQRQTLDRLGCIVARGLCIRAVGMLAIVLADTAVAVAGGVAAEPETQWWKGTVSIPGMPALDYVVVFRPTDQPGDYTATLDIPGQGAVGLPLVDVKLTDTEIAFTLGPPANAVHALKRSEDGKTASGTMTQHGMGLSMTMERITEEQAKSVGPPRPQTPKPPFPYQQREVSYENPADGTHLAGTLTVPEGKGPHPAVLLITGSGSQDRDETIFGHKPFWVIADRLTRNGIAVLRVDDRGVGGSTGANPNVTTEDFVGDVRAGIAFLKGQPDIDGSRIGLVGHSEGGVIAPLVAANSADVACIVMLAGSGVPGGQVLRGQNEALFRAAGASPDRVAAVGKAYDEVIRQVTKGGEAAAIRPAVRNLVQAQLSAQPGSAGRQVPAEQLDTLTDQAMATFTLPWMQWFIKHDPRPTLRKVKCPILALNGTRDLQVLADENLTAIEMALGTSVNRDVTVKRLEGLNHLFQEAKVGTVEEYATISQTISPAVLDEITAWLRLRLGLPPGGTDLTR